MMSKKYVPKKKPKISKKEVESKKNFKSVLNKVKDERKGKLALA